jgi:hypothetical protein
MWVHDHKAVSHTVMTFVGPWPLTSRSNNCFYEGHHGTPTHRLMVMHPHTKYHWPISNDKNVMAQTKKYYLKNNYLTLRSKVKVPRRSLRCVTPPYGHAPTHHIFVFRDRSMIFGMWVPDHKAVCRCTVMTFVGIWRLTSRSNNCFLNSIYLVCGCMTIRRCHTP